MTKNNTKMVSVPLDEYLFLDALRNTQTDTKNILVLKSNDYVVDKPDGKRVKLMDGYFISTESKLVEDITERYNDLTTVVDGLEDKISSLEDKTYLLETEITDDNKIIYELRKEYDILISMYTKLWNLSPYRFMMDKCKDEYTHAVAQTRYNNIINGYNNNFVPNRKEFNV